MAPRWGRVERAAREYGRTELGVKNGSALFAGLPHKLRIWNSHGDHVRALPAGFHVTGETGNAVSGAEDPARKLYAVQFHPEVRHTDCGSEILRNFVFEICHAQPLWSGAAFIAETVEAIRKQVGEGRAICALSGGVDSAVAAVLVHRAIGDRLGNVFVDNGLLEKNEFQQRYTGTPARPDGTPKKVRGGCASKRFLARLKGVTDPEDKRKRIGGEFIAVFDEQARQMASGPDRAGFLVQGTLYPDVIESVAVRGPSQTIKTHHNVGGLPKDLTVCADRAASRAVQGRGAHRPRTGPAGRDADQASLSRAWISRAIARRGERRATGAFTGRGRDCCRGDSTRRTLREGMAGLCCTPAGEKRGRDGR